MWLVLAHLAGGLCVACMAWHPREVVESEESYRQQQRQGGGEGRGRPAGGPRNNKAGHHWAVHACRCSCRLQPGLAGRPGWENPNNSCPFRTPQAGPGTPSIHPTLMKPLSSPPVTSLSRSHAMP